VPLIDFDNGAAQTHTTAMGQIAPCIAQTEAAEELPSCGGWQWCTTNDMNASLG